jgi:hypothetical protein
LLSIRHEAINLHPSSIIIIFLTKMANVIGLFGDSLGIYSISSSLFASAAANVCTVRVGAALNANGLSGADGGVDAIRLYNGNQQLLGTAGGSYVPSGGSRDFAVRQNQQAPLILEFEKALSNHHNTEISRN